MKCFSIIILALFSIFTLNNCNTTKENTATIAVYTDSSRISTQELIIDLTNGKSFNHPTFVIWEENLYGKYIRTVFITKSYASGIFGHEMIGDTMWTNNSGSSYQPAALPYWTYKKGKIDGGGYVPTPEHPFVDAYTGATPNTDFQFKTSTLQMNKSYRLLLEVNQAWDWNSYWSNNKYPNNDAYKHAAQPSIIYSVVINPADSVLYLNPIGHGDPKGESGKLFTNINTLTTAKEIFETVKVTINN